MKQILRCGQDLIEHLEIAPILGHEPAIFSQSWGHFKNLVVTTDDSNYKNYAVVAGSGEGDQRQKVIVDNSGGRKVKKTLR